MMRLGRRASLLLLAVALTGCAADMHWEWTKPDAMSWLIIPLILAAAAFLIAVENRYGRVAGVAAFVALVAIGLSLAGTRSAAQLLAWVGLTYGVLLPLGAVAILAVSAIGALTLMWVTRWLTERIRRFRTRN